MYLNFTMKVEQKQQEIGKCVTILIMLSTSIIINFGMKFIENILKSLHKLVRKSLSVDSIC